MRSRQSDVAPETPGGRDWRDLDWWLYDHVPWQSACFFPVKAAFNITWNKGWTGPGRRSARIDRYIAPVGRLVSERIDPVPLRHARYAGFPRFRGLDLPR